MPIAVSGSPLKAIGVKTGYCSKPREAASMIEPMSSDV